MTKLLSVLIAAMFAAVSVNAIAASHAGAPKDDSKMQKMDKMDKTDKMDKMDKMDKTDKMGKKKAKKPMAKKPADTPAK